ncbi:MAG: CRISPR-associated endonuclease Cas3'' [Gemmobacter sp.]
MKGQSLVAPKCYAHSTTSQDCSNWQLLADHLTATGDLAKKRGSALGLGVAAEVAGLFHDLGKHDPDFQLKLHGQDRRVDHSTAGAWVLLDRVPPSMRPVAEILAYAILGHHAGLPDKSNADGACLCRRVEGFRNRLPAGVADMFPVDFDAVAREIAARTRPGKQGLFDLSVAVRMVFSCLVDADYRDTEDFYGKVEGRVPDRDWPTLSSILPRLSAAFDTRMAGFSITGDLNRLRAEILSYVRGKASMSPGFFTLTVPTGGGKTLASLGFSLDHATLHGHRRIICAIPYTSIIDQTAQEFRDMFGNDVLEHHSAIDEEQQCREGRDKLRLAMEDWAAPIVVTTNVQLFESLFAARPSRCRKLHNIAGSVIVLDEAQCLPRGLLKPVLRMLDTLVTHYGCTVVLCTATQPAFDSRQLRDGGLPLEGRELAPDPQDLARRLRRARIVQGGAMDNATLVAALQVTPQGLVIVNSRAHALDLFRAAQAEGLDGLIHLTTRQYPAHRRRIVDEVKLRLKAGDPCRLIATSLVEAGVDLDFPVGWRAEAGLDSVVQAAGRVNREGTRAVQDSILTVFSAPDYSAPTEVRQLASDMLAIAPKHDWNLLDPAAIRDWFDRVYWRVDAKLDREGIVGKLTVSRQGTDFAFREIAALFRMVDSPMVPVIVPLDEEAKDWVAKLGDKWQPSGKIARALQTHTVQVPAKARAVLVANAHAVFESPDLRGDQFCVLKTMSLYHRDSGLWWEQADYLSDEAWLV